ncbi:MAG TPA: GGDEF domain-containing protein, partial [Noviherbaspirillum sp.]
MRWWQRQCSIAAVFAAIVVPSMAQSAEAAQNVERLLNQVASELKNEPEAAKSTIASLQGLEASFTESQKVRYLKLLSAFYGFQGMRSKQIEASEQALKGIIDPEERASLLYLLADGYANLGRYDNALGSMNESIQLLPKLSHLVSKVDVLQSAVSLLELMGAYDEALDYSERLASLPDDGTGIQLCLSAADKVEIAFATHDDANLKLQVPKAIHFCDVGGYKVISLNVRALDAIDSLNRSNDPDALRKALDILGEFSKANDRSEYSVRIANAVANRYLALGQLTLAAQYGERAVRLANPAGALQLRQQVCETMARILRAEGKLEQALSYANQSNGLWTELLEDQTKKGLAYERMKFRAQDQSAQLKLLGQINQLLTSERELQERNKHILELLVLVTGVLLAFVSVWALRTWRQKNDFRTYSQIDGLTKISNRAHFITCAHGAFKDARGHISVILFDMDEFKLINDTHSHAAGDWVLKSVSSTIAACLRAQDMFGRLGGEEFAICLPRTSEQEAMVLAERCRAAIEAIDSTPIGHHFALSASFGIAVRPPGGTAGFEEVLAAADRVLYQAKHMGRNRI